MRNFSRTFPSLHRLSAAGTPATHCGAQKYLSNLSYPSHRLLLSLAAVCSKLVLALLHRPWPYRGRSQGPQQDGGSSGAASQYRALVQVARAAHPCAASTAPVQESTEERGQCHRLWLVLHRGETCLLGHKCSQLELCQESHFLPSPKMKLSILFFYLINYYQRPLRSSDKLFHKSKLILLSMNLTL